MSITTAAGFVPGETVLVHGVTGVAGRRVVKVTGLLGAGLRTSGVEIYGAVKGRDPQTMQEVYGQIVARAQAGELTFDVERVPLADVKSAWRRTDPPRCRLVVVP